MIVRILDTETTGIERHDEVVQLAAVDLATGDDKPSFFDSRLVRPTRPIPPEASGVHHITDADVANEPFWPDVWPHFFYPGGMEGVVAFASHKASFEEQYITAEMRKGLPIICTWKCALRRWPDAPGHSNQTLRYWLKLKIDWFLILQPEERAPHRAPADALVTSYILAELLKDCTIEQLISWSAEPPMMPTCPIGEFRGKPWPQVDNGFLEWTLTKKDMDPDIIWNVRRELKRRADVKDAADAAALKEKQDVYVSVALTLIKQAITVEDLRSWFAWESEARSSIRIYPGTEPYGVIAQACKDMIATLPPAIPKPEAA